MEETDFAPPHLRRLLCLLLRAPKFIFSNSSRDEFTKKSRENAYVGRFGGKQIAGNSEKICIHSAKENTIIIRPKNSDLLSTIEQTKNSFFSIHNDGFSMPQRGIFAALFVFVSICPRGEVFFLCPQQDFIEVPSFP